MLLAHLQVADWIGIPWSIGVTAILTALAATLVALFYQACQREEGRAGKHGRECKADAGGGGAGGQRSTALQKKGDTDLT